MCVDCANVLFDRKLPCPTCRASFDSYVVGTVLGRKGSFDKDLPLHINASEASTSSPPNSPDTHNTHNNIHPPAPPQVHSDASPSPRCVSPWCCFCVPIFYAFNFLCFADLIWAVAAVLSVISAANRKEILPSSFVAALIKIAVAGTGLFSVCEKNGPKKKRLQLWHYKLWIVRFAFLFLVMALTIFLGEHVIGTELAWRDTTCDFDGDGQSSSSSSSANPCTRKFDRTTVVFLMILSPIVVDDVFLLLPGLMWEVYLILVLRAHTILAPRRVIPIYPTANIAL
eukprot:c5734_g1_i1.p1 GENE.c5734_g1_i1~~c5734_g1_i1.p1  ORF type:complete len:323 (-),score=50.82 c5734_g1_i1:53-904(-)